MTVADTIWVATKLLHNERPKAAGFSRDEIDRKVRELDPALKPATVNLHLAAHCLAWKSAQPSTLPGESMHLPEGLFVCCRYSFETTPVFKVEHSPIEQGVACR